MPYFEQAIEIHAPVHRVFAALTDPKRGYDWNPNIVDVSDIETYPPQEGTSWRQVIMVAGRATKLQCQIVQWDPPRQGELRVSGDQRATIWTRCTAHGEDTRVVQAMEFAVPGGALGKLAEGMIRGALQREVKQTLQRQKQILEREYREESASPV